MARSPVHAIPSHSHPDGTGITSALDLGLRFPGNSRETGRMKKHSVKMPTSESAGLLRYKTKGIWLISRLQDQGVSVCALQERILEKDSDLRRFANCRSQGWQES